jgi:hypothetical protein
MRISMEISLCSLQNCKWMAIRLTQIKKSHVRWNDNKYGENYIYTSTEMKSPVLLRPSTMTTLVSIIYLEK